MARSSAADALRRLVRPWRALASPVFLGLDAIPDERPLLFVGNHTLLGVLDTTLLLAELYERKGILLRALGHHGHFRVPVWRELLTSLGVVNGTRDNCDRLMREGEAILVFPGGAREVAKRRGEKYRLHWKERLGFARMAVRNGCTVVPFAAVGVEDALRIVFDANDLYASPFGPLLRALPVDPDVIMPLVAPLPRPERLYFSFAPPIATRGLSEDDDSCRAVRDQVKAAVELEIVRLRAHQKQDPGRTLLGRVRRALRGKRR